MFLSAESVMLDSLVLFLLSFDNLSILFTIICLICDYHL